MRSFCADSRVTRAGDGRPRPQVGGELVELGEEGLNRDLWGGEGGVVDLAFCFELWETEKVKELVDTGVVGSASIAFTVAGSSNESMVSDWW
jgi:hypothetical protein